MNDSDRKFFEMLENNIYKFFIDGGMCRDKPLCKLCGFFDAQYAIPDSLCKNCADENYDEVIEEIFKNLRHSISLYNKEFSEFYSNLARIKPKNARNYVDYTGCLWELNLFIELYEDECFAYMFEFLDSESKISALSDKIDINGDDGRNTLWGIPLINVSKKYMCKDGHIENDISHLNQINWFINCGADINLRNKNNGKHSLFEELRCINYLKLGKIKKLYNLVMLGFNYDEFYGCDGNIYFAINIIDKLINKFSEKHIIINILSFT